MVLLALIMGLAGGADAQIIVSGGPQLEKISSAKVNRAGSKTYDGKTSEQWAALLLMSLGQIVQ